jgi:hypothetical protein
LLPLVIYYTCLFKTHSLLATSTTTMEISLYVSHLSLVTITCLLAMPDYLTARLPCPAPHLWPHDLRVRVGGHCVGYMGPDASAACMSPLRDLFSLVQLVHNMTQIVH